MPSKGNRRPEDYVNGQGTGLQTQAMLGGEHAMMSHGMKGILGAMRGATYTPSTYGEGDRGGSAGGYGLPHGAAGGGASGPGAAPMSSGGGMPSFGYSGAPLGFEGGVRGGHVSEPESLPAQYPFPAKKGYDEHSARGTVHGMPGVEGLPRRHGGDVGDADMGDVDYGQQSPHGMGHPCGSCGHSFKTPHGLARHTHAKHGYKGLGHALTMGAGAGAGHMMTMHGMRPISEKHHEEQETPAQEREEHRTGREARHMMGHGSTYGAEHSEKNLLGESAGGEFRGQGGEGPKMWHEVQQEFAQAQAKIGVPGGDCCSSYSQGDRSGSYGRMTSIISGR